MDPSYSGNTRLRNLSAFGKRIAENPWAFGKINSMRDDEIRRILVEANPWWRNGSDPVAWVDHHRLLRDRAVYDLGYRSPILGDLISMSVLGAAGIDS